MERVVYKIVKFKLKKSDMMQHNLCHIPMKRQTIEEHPSFMYQVAN